MALAVLARGEERIAMGIDPKTMPDAMRRKLAPEAKALLGNDGLTYDEVRQRSDDKLERVLQSDCMDYLRQRGVHYVAVSRFGRRTTLEKGHPDLMFSLRGHMCAVELKCGANKPTTKQIDVLTRIIQDGGWVAVCYTLEEFIAKVREWLGESNEQPPHHD